MRVARVYDTPTAEDGTRVLVDRLWPRGVRKSAIDVWCRDVAPSAQLRGWFAHRADRVDQFRLQYEHELQDAEHAEALAQLRALAAAGPVTLLTATRDLELSHAPLLAQLLAH